VARVGFLLSQLFAVGVYLFVRQKVVSKADQTKVQVKATPSLANPTPDPNDSITMTYEEYDLSKIKEALQQAVIGCLIIGFLHYKWGYGIPLVIQCVTVPMNLYKSDLIKAHIMDKKVTRPFTPPPSPWANLMDAWKQDGAKPEKKEKRDKKEKRRKVQ
jgi:hypothetical protein